MGRQSSWAISSNVRWAWRLSRRLIWLQSFWNSDIYSSPKFPLFGGTSSFSCMPVFLVLVFPSTPSLLFSLPVSLSPPSLFPFHPVPLYLITSLSLSLAHSPPFKLGSFQISDFHRCARLQSVIFVTDSFIIHCTSKTLECNTWPEFEQESVGYLVSFSYWMQNIEVMLLYSWATREFHMNKLCMYPVCTVVFLHWRFDVHWKACV